MSDVIEFELEHELDYDDAVEVIYEMLDDYYENDDFDELEWDEDEDIAYLSNEAMEIEITVDDNYLEVWAEIFDEDMSAREVERDLRNDLMEYFEVEERPRRRRKGAPRSKSSGRDRRSDRSEESRESSRGSSRKKKKGGNWDMEEEEPKREKKVVVKKEEEKVEESGGSSTGWIVLVVIIIAAVVGFVFFKT